jgi:hypothetical protein
MIEEIVYVNGEVYKESTFDGRNRQAVNTSNGQISKYYINEFNTEDNKYLNNLFPQFSIKENTDGSIQVKTYTPTKQLTDLMGVDSLPVVDLSSGYDLAPAVNLWVIIGRTPADDTYYDLFFKAENNALLQSVADYYSLPFPLPADNDFDDRPEDWRHRGITNHLNAASKTGDVFEKYGGSMGAVTFVNGSPTILKMYKFSHKDKNYASKTLNI